MKSETRDLIAWQERNFPRTTVRELEDLLCWAREISGYDDPRAWKEIWDAGFRILDIKDEGMLIRLDDEPDGEAVIGKFAPLREACEAYTRRNAEGVRGLEERAV